MDAIRAARIDFATTLAALGFLPDWYVSNMSGNSSSNSHRRKGGSMSHMLDAESLDAAATAAGSPDEYSNNARVVKGALCAGNMNNDACVATACMTAYAEWTVVGGLVHCCQLSIYLWCAVQTTMVTILCWFGLYVAL